MAEALISILIEELASRAFQQAEEEVRLVKDVEEDVANLKSNLEAIQAVLQDAEKRQWADRTVRIWLDKLEDVSFKIEDVLDEWSTEIFKLREAENVPFETKKKVCFSVPSVFSCFTSKVNRIALRHDIAHKIKDLNKKLAVIASEKNNYNLNTTTIEQRVERPRTTSFIDDESEVEGRDMDIDILVSKLLLCESSSSHQGKGLEIIPIVGMGGLGKTTLAQLAYNEEKIKTHFDMQIWVCVSDPFDEMKVAKAILEAIEEKAPDLNELENVHQRISKRIEGKRFLLVLDDVWTKEQKKWEQLKRPLKQGVIGSKILVTTRKEEVAIMMGAVKHMITLELLSQEHCWLVFKRQAFLEKEVEERRELEDIGRKIASKCNGLPLVAKTLGGLLRFKKSKTEWEDVLNSELWKSKYDDEVYNAFFLSYYDLSAKEKLCFSYCSVFPKDYLIRRDQLVEMWMSQKHVTSKEEGIECFQNLVMRSFFQNFEKDRWDDLITRCKMHDTMHDFAQIVRKKECIIVDHRAGEEFKLYNEKGRHLTFVVESDAQYATLKSDKMNEENVRTLVIVTHSHYGKHSIDSSLFLNLKRLRTLVLQRSGLKMFPEGTEGIGRLIHLRYLDLSRNSFQELPDSFFDLCNLQTLNLSFTRLQKLPEELGKLANLKHLYIEDCFNLKGLPKGLSRLTCLETLDWFIVAESEGAYLEFGDLKRLKKLRLGKSFCLMGCGNVANGDEAKKMDLKNHQHVTDLSLDFRGSREGNRLENDVEALEALEPTQNLKRLKIMYYMGATMSPRWMISLTRLRELKITYFENCETLPYFGKLPSLESLLLGPSRVKNVGLEFLGIKGRNEEEEEEDDDPTTFPVISFPKLKILKFVCMMSWVKWEGSPAGTETSGLIIMPCLEQLMFVGCPCLQELPDFLETTTSLKKLVITDCTTLEKICRKKTGKEWGKISHVSKLVVHSLFHRHHQEEDDNVANTSPSSSECIMM